MYCRNWECDDCVKNHVQYTSSIIIFNHENVKKWFYQLCVCVCNTEETDLSFITKSLVQSFILLTT